jgi:hypothetical protein
MVPIHDRMPVVLESADWPVWLGEPDGDPAALLRPAADGVLRAWPISTRVNTRRNNTPDLLDEVTTPARRHDVVKIAATRVAASPCDTPAGVARALLAVSDENHATLGHFLEHYLNPSSFFVIISMI